MQLFENKIAETRSQRQSAKDLLTGDHKRMHQFLEETAEGLRSEAADYLRKIANDVFKRSSQPDEAAVRDALAEAIPGYFEHQVGATTGLFGQRIAKTLQPHQERADSLIESVRQSAATLFEIPYYASDCAANFEVVRQPYWVTHKWTSSLSPIPVTLIDRLMPEATLRKRVHKRLMNQIEDLVIPNVENLRWALFQSIDQTFVRFGSTLDKRLAETLEATYGAIQATIDRRRAHSETIEDEVAQLAHAVQEVNQLRHSLGGV